MKVAKDEFNEWKNHAITQAIQQEFQKRINYFINILVDSAGRDPVEDARYSGVIQGYQDFVNCSYEDMEEE